MHTPPGLQCRDVSHQEGLNPSAAECSNTRLLGSMMIASFMQRALPWLKGRSYVLCYCRYTAHHKVLIVSTEPPPDGSLACAQ